MLTLFHYPLFSSCRFIRLIFGEYEEKISLIEEKPWLKRKEFLLLNPAGSVPLLLAESDCAVSGLFPILEYVDETRGIFFKVEKRLFPDNPLQRAETRRLVDWFLVKMEDEVTRHLLRERVLKSMFSDRHHDGSPDSSYIRAARLNIKQHMKYLNWLSSTRNWLAGSALSYGDLAAAGALSVLDYLGEIDWSQYPCAREWYTKMKSRPSFRPLLADRIPGLLPVSHYANLDF